MPHLQFEINKTLQKEKKKEFIVFVEKKFSKIMQTGTDHIAVTIREFEKENISLGRTDKNDFVCLMNLDIRVGRTKKQKLELVKAFIVGVEKFFEINKKGEYRIKQLQENEYIMLSGNNKNEGWERSP